MSLLSVVNDVCRVVGVHELTSVINNTLAQRTAAEMLSLANEMAQRIACDTREWTIMYKVETFHGNTGVPGLSPHVSLHLLPEAFKRFRLTSNIYRSTSATYPMRFIPDEDTWLQRRLLGYADPRGEWIRLGKIIHISPPLAAAIPPAFVPGMAAPAWATSHAYSVNDIISDVVSGVTTYWYAVAAHTSPPSGTFAQARAANPAQWATCTPEETATFVYMHKNCVEVYGGGGGTADFFSNDNDTFVLDERLLKLGMIWQWKAQKGSPYAEDMASYETALARVAGADVPAPIIIDRLPISSAARVAFPWPGTWP
jgi:hypothetical protein